MHSRFLSFALVPLTFALACLGAVTAPRLLAEEAEKDWSTVAARPTPDWVRESVVYEIFPRQFSASGNFAGITARLDELKALGVDVLWLMPIHPMGRVKVKGSLGSPYAVQDYYAVNPDYGTGEDLRLLVRAAHARGMKVIIDIVANHTAWDSVMMANKAYYRKDASGQVISPYDWTDVAALDYGNPDTRQYMREMLKYWVRDYKLDGFRCDVAGEVPTDFWESVRGDLEQLHPGVLLLAEASKPELLAKAFDLDYAWPMLGTLNKVFMEGAPATAIRDCWRNGEQRAFPKGALHLRMSDDHDEARAVARYGWNAALAASALLFTMDGVPLLYNGQEVGDSSESGDPALFEKLPVFWAPKQRTHFRETYRALIALRHAHSALTHGSLSWLENSNAQNVVSFVRQSPEEALVTVVNVANRPSRLGLSVEQAADYVLLMNGNSPVSAEGKALPVVAAEQRLGQDLQLGAYEWRIYRRALKH